MQRDGGLGLVLAEMWADGSGRGLVLVEEIAAGSNAAKCGGGIAVGDALIGISGKGGLAEGQGVEGRDWEETVAALGDVEGSEITLFMKRLVQRGRISVSVTSSSGIDLGTFTCASGANLRMEFLRRQLPQVRGRPRFLVLGCSHFHSFLLCADDL